MHFSENLGHTGTCQCCHTSIEIDPNRYSTIAKKNIPLDRLQQETFPDVNNFYSDRLILERQIRKKSVALSTTERNELISEPFQHFIQEVEIRYGGKTYFDKESATACLATLGVSAILLYACIETSSNESLQNKMFIAFGVTFAIGFIYSMIQLGLTPSRYIKRQVAPKIAQALKPLEPEKNELISALKRLEQSGYKIGKKLKISTLQEQLERANQSEVSTPFARPSLTP